MPISSKNLASALIGITEENLDKQKEIIGNFIQYCKKRGMIHKLGNVLKYIELKNEKEKNKEILKIISAEKIDKKILKKIIKKTIGLPSSNKIKTIINNNIIGGFIVEYKGTVYDASIKGQLEQIKNKLII